MSGHLEGLVNERAQELADGLWVLFRAAVRLPGGRALVTPLLVSLAEELQEQAATSEFGTGADGSGRLVNVRGYQDAASAAESVGLSGRWVRQLCHDGLVAHQRVGRRGYLVDVNDLRRYLRGEAA